MNLGETPESCAARCAAAPWCQALQVRVGGGSGACVLFPGSPAWDPARNAAGAWDPAIALEGSAC